jgi:hypothetical protein
VLSLCEYRELLDHEAAKQIYPPDAIAVRAIAACAAQQVLRSHWGNAAAYFAVVGKITQF